MKAASLRLRLLLGAMVAIFAALAIAWVAMTLLFERHIERRAAEDLIRNGLELSAALSLAPGGAPQVSADPGDPRFDAPGGGLYWQVSSPAGAIRSRSLWDQALPAKAGAPSEDWRTRRQAGPLGQGLLVVERIVRPDRGGPPVLIQVAQDEGPLQDARSEFGRELAGFLVLLWAVLTGAAWLQVRLGLQPLARVRDDLAALTSSPAARLGDGHPREIEPLVSAINALAEAREGDLQRARRRAADLAHGLKTPLAALAAQSRRAREAGATEAADGLERALAAVGSAVEAELARTRITTIGAGLSPVRKVAERLVRVVEHTDAGSAIDMAVEVPADLRVPLAEDDLGEILGPLLENAARYARRQVRVGGASDAGRTLILVEDDGPGIADELAAQALARGGRLDESGGDGLGLAIARDLTEATGGSLELSRSELGGLMVRLAWPVG